MGIQTRWTVKIGRNLTSDTEDDEIPTDAIDFTSRTVSLSVTENVKFGESARANATVVLLNEDGDLTPGGSGTYGDYDWIGQPMWVVPEFESGGSWVNWYKGAAFGGFITNIDFQDDGFTSTLTISAADWFQIMGQAVVEQTYSITGAILFSPVVALGLERYVPNIGTEVVKVSNTPIRVGFVDLSMTWDVGSVYGDQFSTVMAAEFGVVLPPHTWMLFDPFPSGPTLTDHYRGFFPRENSWPQQFTGGQPLEVWTMDADGAFGSASNIPFRNPRYGFQLESLYNQATVTRTGGAAQIADNRFSQTKRGARSIVLSDLPFDSDGDAFDLAQNIINRYADDSSIIQSVEITGGMIRDKVDDLNVVFDVMSGNWWSKRGLLHRPINVKGTGAGGQTIDQWVTFYERRVEATPADWVVTLSGGREARSTMTFVLDSVPVAGGGTTTYFSTLGDIQTYEESGATYNDFGFAYDGTAYDGARLG